jgi:PTH1 family peptidyl-tRNA hydrolase
MKYIIGLGNPDKEYQKNRHNIGFIVLDKLIEYLNIGDKFSYNAKFKAEIIKGNDLIFIKPMNYMNNSGQVSRSVIDFYGKDFDINDVIVIHDDLDIELGQYKIQQGKGPKVHNGLIDLNQHLNSENYWHVRVGVDGRDGDRTIPGSNYVLSNFTDSELKLIDASLEKMFTELKSLIES